MDPHKRLSIAHWKLLERAILNQVWGGGGGVSMKELWLLEENEYKMVKHCLHEFRSATSHFFFPPFPRFRHFSLALMVQRS